MFIEDNSSFNNKLDYSTDNHNVGGAKDLVADTIAVVSESGASDNRLLTAHYITDQDSSTSTVSRFAYIVASELNDVGASSDLQSTDDFGVIGVARLADITMSSLDVFSNFNVVAPFKDEGLEGA